MSKEIIDWEELNLEEILQPHPNEEDDFQSGFISRYNDKVFKYYVLNTNFNLSAKILREIADVPGVERIIPISRYRALVNFGKLFTPEEVQKLINKEVSKLFYPKELRKKVSKKSEEGVD